MNELITIFRHIPGINERASHVGVFDVVFFSNGRAQKFQNTTGYIAEKTVSKKNDACSILVGEGCSCNVPSILRPEGKDRYIN